MDWLTQLTLWHWFIGGLALMILEVLVPGVIFLWLGVAAIVTGLILAVVPEMSPEYQLIAFAVLSVVSVLAGRMWLKHKPLQTDHPNLNRRGQQYVGRRFNLSEAIVNGSGKIKVDDSTWKVTGEDMAEGQVVEVTGVEGTVLQVEPRD